MKFSDAAALVQTKHKADLSETSPDKPDIRGILSSLHVSNQPMAVLLTMTQLLLQRDG